MLNLVESLKLPKYIRTNQDSYRTAHIERLVGKYFDGIFSSYQIGYLKPGVDFYAYIENKLNLPPKELLLIDDTHANIKMAEIRGWQTYYYQGDFEALLQFINNKEY